MKFSYEIASDLEADGQTVLEHAATLQGANRELGPLLHMTSPSRYRGMTLFDAPIGEPLFRSFVLFAGVLPIDFDHLCFESIDRDSGFVESSTMLSMKSWRHERRVTSRAGGGARLTDRLTFTPRIPGTGALLAAITGLLFRHRHRRLKALFGDGSETHLPAGQLA